MTIDVPPLTTALCAVCVISACVNTSMANDEKVADLAQQVRYVAGAVQSFVKYEVPATDTMGAELIAVATQVNPRLLEPFVGYYLTARRAGPYSAVLLCDIGRSEALVEDAGCTNLKTEWWQSANSPPRPCEFHLELKSICAAR